MLLWGSVISAATLIHERYTDWYFITLQDNNDNSVKGVYGTIDASKDRLAALVHVCYNDNDIFFTLQDNNDNPVQALYGSNADPSKGRLATVDAGAILEKMITWCPNKNFAIPTNYDHVMYWVGWVSGTGFS